MKTAPSSLVRTSIVAALFALVTTVACAQTVYVTNAGNNTISQVVSGTVTQFASGIGGPMGVTFGPGGNLYVAANASSGENVVTVAPNGTVTPLTTLSSIHQPIGLTFGAGGNLYVATNNENWGVDQVTVPGGTVTHFTAATSFVNATAVAFSAGTLFVADYGNNTISKVAANGAVSSWTLTGDALNHPYGLAFGPGGILYVANYGNGTSGNGFISKVDTFGVVSTWAVTGVTFYDPTGLAFEPNGNLLVANYGANNVLEITASGSGSVFATGFSGPGGIAVSAIPEPSTHAALFGLAALGFAAYRRRHRQMD